MCVNAGSAKRQRKDLARAKQERTELTFYVLFVVSFFLHGEGNLRKVTEFRTTPEGGGADLDRGVFFSSAVEAELEEQKASQKSPGDGKSGGGDGFFFLFIKIKNQKSPSLSISHEKNETKGRVNDDVQDRK